MKTMSMTGLCVLALSMCAAPALAQAPAAPAPQGRGHSPAASVVSPAGRAYLDQLAQLSERVPQLFQ